MDTENGKVDFSKIMMPNEGLIVQKQRCILCGLRRGHKAKCYDPNCRTMFHVTCARQAGFEVNRSGGTDGKCYGMFVCLGGVC